VVGAALPWVITHGDGTVRADGQVEVNVRGLVQAREQPVPSNQQGMNPNPTFVVIVSCVTTQGSGTPHDASVSTPAFTASAVGDAHVEAMVTLPTPCLAPVLFVAGNDQAWIAVTGAPPSSADGGTADAGVPADAGAPDAGVDAGTADAGTPDAGHPDAGMPDAGMHDGGMPDGGSMADAGA
jgi:hypothetical protein